MKTRTVFVLALVFSASLAASAQGTWQEFSSPEGRFTVLFPAAPTAGGGNLLHSFTYKASATVFQVSYMDAPDFAGQPPESVLDASRDANLGSDNVLVGEEAAPLQGYAGRRVRLKSKDGSLFYWIRLLWVDNARLYQVIVASGQPQTDAVNAQRFQDSFRLTSAPAGATTAPAPSTSTSPAPATAVVAGPQAFYSAGIDTFILETLARAGIDDAADAQRAARTAADLQYDLQALQAPADLRALAQKVHANYQQPPKQHSGLEDPPVSDFLAALDHYTDTISAPNQFFYSVGVFDGRGKYFGLVAANQPKDTNAAEWIPQEQKDLLSLADGMQAICPRIPGCPPEVTQDLKGIVPILQRATLSPDDLAQLGKFLDHIDRVLALPGPSR